MLKVSRQFQYLFLLIFRNTFKLTKNAISENSIVFKVFLKKILQFLLYYQIFDLKAMFLLMLLLNYSSIEK